MYGIIKGNKNELDLAYKRIEDLWKHEIEERFKHARLIYNVNRKDMVFIAGDRVIYLKTKQDNGLSKPEPFIGTIQEKLSNTRYLVNLDDYKQGPLELPGSMLRKYQVELQ